MNRQNSSTLKLRAVISGQCDAQTNNTEYVGNCLHQTLDNPPSSAASQLIGIAQADGVFESHRAPGPD